MDRSGFRTDLTISFAPLVVGHVWHPIHQPVQKSFVRCRQHNHLSRVKSERRLRRRLRDLLTESSAVFFTGVGAGASPVRFFVGLSSNSVASSMYPRITRSFFHPP